MSYEVNAKRVELLREAFPHVTRVAILSNPLHPGEQRELKESEQGAKRLDIGVSYAQMRSAAEIEPAFERIRAAGAEAMIALPDGLVMQHRKRIIEFAVLQRIPVISGWSEFAKSGGTMTYGRNLKDLFQRLAIYVDKIIKGANAGELAVEQPTKFELVINLKAAKAIGLEVSPILLGRADEVIEQRSYLLRCIWQLLALLRHADRFSQCPLSGEDRKCTKHGQNDAIEFGHWVAAYGADCLPFLNSLFRCKVLGFGHNEQSSRGQHAAARVHDFLRQRGSCLADHCTSAKGRWGAAHRMVRARARGRALALLGFLACRLARVRLDRRPQSDNWRLLGNRAGRHEGAAREVLASNPEVIVTQELMAIPMLSSADYKARSLRLQRRSGRGQTRAKLGQAGQQFYRHELSGH